MTGEDRPETHRNRNNKVSDSNKYDTPARHLLARVHRLVFLLLLFVPWSYFSGTRRQIQIAAKIKMTRYLFIVLLKWMSSSFPPFSSPRYCRWLNPRVFCDTQCIKASAMPTDVPLSWSSHNLLGQVPSLCASARFILNHLSYFINSEVLLCSARMLRRCPV